MQPRPQANAKERAALKTLREHRRRFDGHPLWKHFGLRYLSSLLLTGVSVLFFVLFFGVRFEVNDDATISNIASGAFGPDSQYLVYVNILIGYALKPFYAMFAGLNWFVILPFSLAVLCFALLGALLMDKAGALLGAGLHCLFLAVAGQSFFTVWHYSKYAGLFLAVGLLLMALNLGKLNAGSIGGAALALLGSMFRFEQFLAVGGISAALLLYRFFKLDKRGKIIGAASVAAMIALCFGANLLHSAVYASNADWARYQRYNAVRTDISDYRMQFADREALYAMGMSNNDVMMLEHWLYYDNEVFPAERLEAIRDAMPANGKPVQALRDTAVNYASIFFGSPLNLLLSAMLLFWLLFSKKRGWPMVVGTLALLAAMIFVLQFSGRYIERVEYSLVLAAILFMVPALNLERPASGRAALLVAGVLLVVLVPHYRQVQIEQQAYLNSRLYRHNTFSSFFEDKQHLYLVDVEYYDIAAGYDVWHTLPKNAFSNMVFVESWTMYTPFQEEALQRFGLGNPYRDSLGRQDVIWLDGEHTEIRENFLQEHYHPDARMVKLEEYYNYQRFAAVTQPSAPEDS